MAGVSIMWPSGTGGFPALNLPGPGFYPLSELNASRGSSGGGGGGNFNIPTNLYPRSGSSNQSTSGSAINWKSPLGKTLLPLITDQANRLPGLVDSLPGTIQGRYDALMRDAMKPQNFQGVLNQLANRGTLSSTEAGVAMGNMATKLAKLVAGKGYESEIQGIQAQMQLPGILGQLAELARVSEAQSTSKSGQSNPLAPYELMLKAMMY